MSLDTRVLVAAHKPYWMPSDKLYMPVQVNAAQAVQPIPGFERDDTGDNISSKNGRYCELTALWWGWRNLDSKALGLVHYRRHFAGKGERRTLTTGEAKELLGRFSVVLPKKRNYVIESIAAHYAHTHDGTHLEVLRRSLERVSPHRIEAFDSCMRSTSAHMFNMLIMDRQVLDPYCTWLFDVLQDAERHIDFGSMNAFQERCMGRLAELLLDVWINSEGVPYAEVAVRELEGRSLIKRGTSFLAAKFLGKSYDKSF